MTNRWTRRQFTGRALAVSAASAAVLSSLRPVSAAAKAKVVVIGGGAGGATAARYIADGSKDVAVTLVGDVPRYTTCYFSNLYIGGFRSFESITHDYDALRDKHGIKVLIDQAAGVDPDRRRVSLRDGGSLSYDRLVVAPGIDFRYEAIEGYTPEAARTMPHAWRTGEQAQILKRQITDMADGGTFVVCPPANPYRCPPAPYERVSLVAHYFKSYKPRSKILIIDAKDKFAKQALFEEAWLRFYPGMIEWLNADFTGGGVKAVDPATRTLILEDEEIAASVANVIPPQKAGEIAQQAGLADESGWCPIVPATLASRLQPDIHVVGDAIIPGDMPKSAFAANSQAKVCARAVLGALVGAKTFEPRFRNTCWSLLATDHTVKVGANYRAAEDKITKIDSFISQLDESDELRAKNAREAEGWYEGISADIFG